MSDCEIPAWYVCTEPMARKQHRCVECSAPILPGEKYLRVQACYDRQPVTEKQHLLCALACEFVRDQGWNDDECLYFGELKEWWSDQVRGGGFYPAPQMEARRKLWRLMLRIKRREAKSRRKEGVK